MQAYPVPTISWHINGIEIKPSPKYTVRMEHNKSVLLINNVQVADSGVYTCRAVSEVGEAISSTTLYVTGEWSSLMQRPSAHYLGGKTHCGWGEIRVAGKK